MSPAPRVPVEPSYLTNIASLSFFYEKPTPTQSAVDTWCRHIFDVVSDLISSPVLVFNIPGRPSPVPVCRVNLHDIMVFHSLTFADIRVPGSAGNLSWSYLPTERVPPPSRVEDVNTLTLDELRSRWEPSLGHIMDRDSSCGLLPGVYQTTSSSRVDMYAHLMVNGNELQFLRDIERIYYLIAFTDRNASLPLSVYGKPEDALQWKKLFGTYCHRTIVMPDIISTIIEHRLSLFRVGNDVLSANELCACNRHTINPKINSLAGACPKEIHRFLSEHATGLSLDVSKWDRSLPSQVISSFFEAWLPLPPSRARWFGLQNNGGGTYVVNGHGFRFNDVVGWSSGQLMTLDGNGIIHAGLLRSIGITNAIVMGDDCYVYSTDHTVASLTSGYAAAGLVLKECVPEPVFCKVDGRTADMSCGVDVAWKMALYNFPLSRYPTTTHTL